MGNFFISTVFILLKFAIRVRRATSFSNSVILRSSSSIVMYILLLKKLEPSDRSTFFNYYAAATTAAAPTKMDFEPSSISSTAIIVLNLSSSVFKLSV